MVEGVGRKEATTICVQCLCHSLFIEVDSVMMLTTSITTTTWMLSVLAYTTVAGADVTTLLTILLQRCSHLEEEEMRYKYNSI